MPKVRNISGVQRIDHRTQQTVEPDGVLELPDDTVTVSVDGKAKKVPLVDTYTQQEDVWAAAGETKKKGS